MEENDFSEYMSRRLEDQLAYFDTNAIKYRKRYKALKAISVACNILTTMTIALAFTVPAELKVPMGILALILSTIVLATYQWEEFQNYGAKWERFRLVSEELKAEKMFFVYNAGRYSSSDVNENKRKFVETVEHIIRQTDYAFFSMMVEPGKRIEKRLQNPDVS